MSWFHDTPLKCKPSFHKTTNPNNVHRTFFWYKALIVTPSNPATVTSSDRFIHGDDEEWVIEWATDVVRLLPSRGFGREQTIVWFEIWHVEFCRQQWQLPSLARCKINSISFCLASLCLGWTDTKIDTYWNTIFFMLLSIQLAENIARF